MENTTLTPKPKTVYTKTHAIFAILSILLGTLYFRFLLTDAFWRWEERGIAIFVFAAAFCAFGFVFFKLRKKTLRKESLFFMGLTLIFALRFLFYNTGNVISVLAIFVIHLTALLFLASAGAKTPVMNKIIPASFMAVFVSPFANFAHLPLSFSGFGRKSDSTNESKRGVNALFILAGIGMAVPILVVVIALLSTDAFFSGFIRGIIELIDSLNLNINVFDFINPITILVTFYIYGALFSADKEKTENKNLVTNIIPNVVSNTIMIMLLAVYALFFMAQIEGYICMIMGRIPAYTTYAEFARSGFFQLCIVACINGILMYAFNAFPYDGKSKWLRILSLILTAVTLILILSSAAKMIFYISAYGFTPKRFYTMLFMLLLAILFVLALIKLKKDSFNFSKAGVYITTIWLLILFFVDFSWLSNQLNTALGF